MDGNPTTPMPGLSCVWNRIILRLRCNHCSFAALANPTDHRIRGCDCAEHDESNHRPEHCGRLSHREYLTPEDDRKRSNYRKTCESRDESDRKQLVPGVLKCAGSEDYGSERKWRRSKAAQHDSVGSAFIHLVLPIIKPFPAHHLFETGFPALPGKEV